MNKQTQEKWCVKVHKKVYKTLNQIENLLILNFKFTGSFSISAFASSVDILVGIASSAVALETCAITAGIKKYKSI